MSEMTILMLMSIPFLLLVQFGAYPEGKLPMFDDIELQPQLHMNRQGLYVSNLDSEMGRLPAASENR